jgi:hypothetical protein
MALETSFGDVDTSYFASNNNVLIITFNNSETFLKIKSYAFGSQLFGRWFFIMLNNNVGQPQPSSINDNDNI